ncbi:prepilin-type N-terminal cleavage/methylation domain-containing protein [bacterium]|nr:prepilin-type N-terminal cleavage/methylation domain-containing protein [bacterium]
MMRKKGFTLLELLIVVAILATLVALALPYYEDYLAQTKITGAQVDLQTYAKALAMYDQLEPSMFSDNTNDDLRPLIGKYLQDYRTSTVQTKPRDPWGQDYRIRSSAGTIICAGPNGSFNTTDSGLDSDRIASFDDILIAWKPPFFVSGSRAVSNVTVEVTFSRKVVDSTVPDAGAISAMTGGGGGASTAKQRVSGSLYRFTVPTITMNGGVHTVTLVNTIQSQDLKTGFHLNPNGSAGTIASFTF